MGTKQWTRLRNRYRSTREWSRRHVDRRHNPEPCPRSPAYHNRLSLLSRGEAAFFGPLCQAVNDRFLIMCKVRLADIVTCSEDDWRRGFGAAIAQKHLDFVLCDLETTRFVLAIELDDRSHARPHRRRRDRFVNRVLAQAGVRLIRFRASAWYSVAAIRERVLDGLDDANMPQHGDIHRRRRAARSIG